MAFIAGAEAKRDLWNVRGQFVTVFLWRQTVLGPQLRHESKPTSRKNLNSPVEGTKPAGAQGEEPWSGKATSPLVSTSVNQEQLCCCPGSGRLPPEAKDQTQPRPVAVLSALWECFKMCASLYCSRTSYKRPWLKRIMLIMGEKKIRVWANKKTACIGTAKAKWLFRLVLHSHSWNKGGVAQVIVGLNHCKKPSGLRYHFSQPQHPLPPTG